MKSIKVTIEEVNAQGQVTESLLVIGSKELTVDQVAGKITIIIPQPNISK